MLPVYRYVLKIYLISLLRIISQSHIQNICRITREYALYLIVTDTFCLFLIRILCSLATCLCILPGQQFAQLPVW